MSLLQNFIPLQKFSKTTSDYGYSSFKTRFSQKILNTKNPSLLFRINNILKKEVEKDWWDQLPREVQDSIFEGIQDIEEGKIFTHDQVIQEAKQKYGF
jgi:CTP:phosphocholine cytidylyltransferase-like protein